MPQETADTYKRCKLHQEDKWKGKKGAERQLKMHATTDRDRGRMTKEHRASIRQVEECTCGVMWSQQLCQC